MPNALSRLFFKETPISVRASGSIGDPTKSVYDLIQGLFSGKKTFASNPNAVLSITPAWRAIYILKDILSTMPLNLYKLESDGDINIAKEHPLNKLISVKPHALYTPFEWMSGMMVSALMGNGFSKIIRNGSGTPSALQFIPLEYLKDILLGEDGQHLIYQFQFQNGALANIHSDDIIHFMGLSTNALAGLNVPQTHAETFVSEMALRDYVKTFLENGAFLSGVIEVPNILADNVYKRMKSSWEDSYGGARKAGKTPIMEGGSKFTPIQASISQTGFEEVKTQSVADISRIYGVPEYMLDARNKPTYSSVEQMSIDFKKYTVDGWCKKIEQELNRKLISESNRNTLQFMFDTTGLTTGDMKTMGEFYNRLFNMSVLNADEIRSYLKKNKVEHGNRYFIQGNNMVPVDKIDDALANKGNKKNIGADMQTVKET